MLKFVIITRL